MSDYIKREDTISRQAAIDAFGLSEKTRKYGGDHSGYGTMMLYEIQDTLESLSPAQQWIPCSERLPEEFYVLCCDNHGEMLIANPFECDDSDTGFSAESEDCYMYNCVAWMPLPEPYKGEEK